MSGRRRSVKREHRKAIRVSLAIFLACVAGYSVDLESANTEWFKAACKWAAITAAIVAQPLLGSAARTGAERVLGTVLGGSVGLVLHHSVTRLHLSDAADGLIKAVACAALAAVAILIGEEQLKLNYSAKLFQITLLLVTFAAEGSAETEHLYFISRVAGIASGVILMLVLSVVLLPKSATKEALKELDDALDDLIMLTDELFGMNVEGSSGDEDETRIDMALLKDRGTGNIAKRFSLLAENLLEMQDNVVISSSERVIATKPSLILLPRLLPSKQPVLPSLELSVMADNVRQVAGSLSFLHRAVSLREDHIAEDIFLCDSRLADFIGLLRQVLMDVKAAFPYRQLAADARTVGRLETLMEMSGTYAHDKSDQVCSAALRFAAIDVQELWKSCEIVVPLLPTANTV
jgi:hypothetical protein